MKTNCLICGKEVIMTDEQIEHMEDFQKSEGGNLKGCKCSDCNEYGYNFHIWVYE